MLFRSEWMTKEIKDLNDQSSDLGFRLVWGMERPDLVLTETLNFHDLGIADTKLEQDTDENVGNVVEGPDDTYDQVKRPVGSTYLELYCTANPNVPQSRELYDYDNGVWKLRLSKTTPVYTDSLGRELEMPVWRVAISDSSVPAKWNGVKEDVYRKKTNNVLEWFKDDDYSRWFFTMQPPQFRNYPTDYPKVPDNSSAVLIDSIAQLDAYELDTSGPEEEDNSHKDVKEKAASEVLDRVLKDWEKFDFPTSNVLGPAVASKKAFDRSKSSNRDNSWRKREIALDRVVWFTKALGDAGNDNDTKLGTAGEYPDALRTFCKTTNDAQYLEPNQYLIVGPDEKRSVGSTYYDPNNENARFGVDANSAVNVLQLSDIGTNLLSKPAFSGNYTFMVAKSNIGGVGLNISEPLWTASKKDPYEIPYAENQKFHGKTRIIDPSLDPKGDASAPDGLETARCSVMDVPFELRKDMDEDKRADVPDDDYDNVVGNYPIVKDGLFGIGTVPAYKSSFVQRVADPNRPYHPLMNPYITVDWNVMDLTVFTGERVGMGDEYESSHRIAEKGYSNSEIKLKKNDFLKVDDDDTFKLEDVFSSRQWGNSSQKSFNKPSSERPNPWARAFEFDDNDNTGLQRPRDRQDPSVVLKFAPSHTLGMFNNMGDRGNWVADPNDPNNTIFDKNPDGATFKGLNEKYLTSGDVYKGAPRKPFEHLVWNDAPYSNPMELALVPASSSSRFGLEFVRNDKVGDDIGKLYEYEADKFKNKSLGSHGLFGFEDWQGKDDKKRGGVPGSYLNFFVSSRKAGETLNLCKALEFVSVPSLYLGTKRLITDTNDQYIEDENGNPLFFSRRREPGKVNINTVNESVWKAISPNSDRILAENRLPSVEWSDFQDSRNAGDFFCYFQPSHTLGLWVQLNKSSAPCPSFSSIMAQNQCDLDSASSGDFEALLDNTVPRRDDDGEILYTYTFLEDPNDPDSETHSGVGTLEEVDAHQPGVLSCEKLTEKRGNLYEATAEMQRLSGLTTTRSNAFAVWVTVGYFEVERCNPGVNMPNVDPDGNTLTFDMLIDPSYKWYHYYQAIYPDGYTYGKELGSEFGETRRHRGFSIIDRSIPVDFRRGNSGNYENAILLKRVID